MSIQILQTFLVWSTIINVGILMLSFLICTFAGNWVYNMHARWFPMPRETFNAIIYCFIGFYKIVVITFNIVPLIALLIAT